MRKKNVWKQALALVLSTALVLGSGMPVSAEGTAAGDGAGTAAEGTDDTPTISDPEAYQEVTFDFEDGEIVSGDDAAYTENGIKFTNDGVEIVDAPVVSGDNAQRGKALKFSRTKEMTVKVDGVDTEVTTGNSCLTTEVGALSKYDFSNGVTLSMDIYPEAQRDWNYLFGLGVFGEKWVTGTIGFIAAFGEPWTNRFPNQDNGWLDGNNVNNNYNYFSENENVNKWYRMDYVYTKDGLTIKVDGVPTVAYTVGAEEMQSILQEASKGQLRLGMGPALINEGFLGYMDNVTLTPVAPHAHTYGEDDVIDSRASTCTEAGFKKVKCTTCDGIVILVIPQLPHNYGTLIDEDPATCAKAGKKAHYKCDGCNQYFVDDESAESGKKAVLYNSLTIPKKAHTYGEPEITKATAEKNGIIKSTCSACNDVKTETIPMASDITLKGTSYAYTGKAIEPEVTVKDSEGTVIAADNYTVTYVNNTNVGTAKAVITFKADSKNYAGTAEKTFTITGAPASDTGTLTLDTASVTLYTGKASNKATVKATASGGSKVEWKSDNPKVATVKDGVITAVKAGKTTITATANGITQKVTVTVKNPTITVKNGKKNAKSVTVKKGKKLVLTVSVNPSKAGSSMVNLTKKQKKIASITYKKGKLTIKGKKKGSVTIKIKSGGATKNIKVKVK